MSAFDSLDKAVCDERTRLLSEYNSATLALSASVGELIQKTATIPKGEYRRLKNAADQSRIAATFRIFFPGKRHRRRTERSGLRGVKLPYTSSRRSSRPTTAAAFRR